MSREFRTGSSCVMCETPVHVGCDCVPSREQGVTPELTPETLGTLKNLEIEIRADFHPTLTALRTATGVDLQPREEGYHITVVAPTEYKALESLSDDDVRELQVINAELQSGQGIVVRGVGYIDGSGSVYPLRESDKEKKVAFVALDIPKLVAFREKVGLPPKDFHATLGFEQGDIHMQVTGQEEYKPGKFKDILSPVPKKADDRFADIAAQLPEMTFGGLSGEEKEKKVVKVDKTKKEKRREDKSYDVEKLRKLLTDLVADGKSGGVMSDQIDQIVTVAATDPTRLGNLLQANYRFVAPILSQCEIK